MSLSSQTVQLKLHNVIDVHTCQLSWSLRADDGDYWVSPTFHAIGNHIPWCVQLRWDNLAGGTYFGTLCMASGGIGNGVSIAGNMKIIIPRENLNENPWVTETYFSTSKHQVMNKEKTLTTVCHIGGDSISRIAHGKKRSMTLTCVVSFIELDDIVSRVLSNEQTSVPSTDLYTFCASRSAGFAKFYLNETGSDVLLVVNGNEYPAHKLILTACSDVFEAMFKHDMQENRGHRVEIDDIDEKLFLEALKYMYTGQVEDLDALVFDLVKVADKYDIKGLRDLCGVVLHGKLSIENALEILLVADSCNVDNLKSPAVEYFARYSKYVLEEMSEDEWKELVARPNLMKRVLQLCMDK